MKTWTQVKTVYFLYLAEKKLKQPQRRVSALKKIEACLQSNYPGLFKGYALFTQIEKDELKDRLKNWKGKALNGAENQVINDFYRLAMLKISTLLISCCLPDFIEQVIL